MARQLRRRPRTTPLLPSDAAPSEPVFIVQSGCLKERVQILGTASPVQIRELVIWENEEEGEEWGIVVARLTVGDLAPEEREELPGRYLRPVNDSDWAEIKALREEEQSAAVICRDRIIQRQLPMKLLGADWRFDRKKITFHFAAEHRVDFRLLVRDLASRFRCRIELHQVGARDEAALYGGMGTCGRELCCHQHLDQFPHVAVRMARLQNLSLDPGKTSGVCGRLKCCLRYEYDLYEELADALPDLGSRKELDGVPAEVIQQLPLSGLVVARYDDGRFDTLTPVEWETGQLDRKRPRPRVFVALEDRPVTRRSP